MQESSIESVYATLDHKHRFADQGVRILEYFIRTIRLKQVILIKQSMYIILLQKPHKFTSGIFAVITELTACFVS